MFEEIDIDKVSQEDLNEALDTRWVHPLKGLFVNSRLTMRGFARTINGLDDTYASTPILSIKRVLLLYGLLRQLAIRFFGMRIAFLHADLTTSETIYVWPPPEVTTGPPSKIWKLLKAMYGLRPPPRNWQVHLASLMTTKLVHCKFSHFIRLGPNWI